MTKNAIRSSNKFISFIRVTRREHAHADILRTGKMRDDAERELAHFRGRAVSNHTDFYSDSYKSGIKRKQSSGNSESDDESDEEYTPKRKRFKDEEEKKRYKDEEDGDDDEMMKPTVLNYKTEPGLEAIGKVTDAIDNE